MSKNTARRGRGSEQGENRAIGRPRVTLSDLPHSWEAIMTALYQDGASDVEVRVALAIPPSRAMSDDLWYDLIEREPDFSRAVKAGQALAEAWWNRMGRDGICHPTFKTSLWIVQMRNRFGFKGADRVPVNPPELEHDASVQVYIPDNSR